MERLAETETPSNSSHSWNHPLFLPCLFVLLWVTCIIHVKVSRFFFLTDIVRVKMRSSFFVTDIVHGKMLNFILVTDIMVKHITPSLFSSPMSKLSPSFGCLQQVILVRLSCCTSVACMHCSCAMVLQNSTSVTELRQAAWAS